MSAWALEGLGGLPFRGKERMVADARTLVAAAHRNQRLTLQVLDALSAAGVTPIALKGSVLATRLYPMPLARPATDVDVLVSPTELEAAGAALSKLGLARQADPALADPFEEHHHLAWAGPRGLVEVHFRLISSLGRGLFDDAAIRARARDFTFEGRQVRLLSPEDEFLYLAVHAANHGFLRASWLVDLQLFLTRDGNLDFETMMARAADAGFRHALLVTLRLLERGLDVQLPPQARELLDGRRRRGHIDRLLFSPPRVERAAWSTSRVGSVALRLWMVDSPQRGAHHLLDGLTRAVRRARADR